MSLIVEVRNLRKYFPIERGIFLRSHGFIKAIDGINFDVIKGETLGIAGRSGSGKSTLAKLLLRLISPTAGKIMYNSEEITNFRKDTQIIFQNPYQSLNPKMRILDILAEPLIVHKLVNKRGLRGRVLDSLERVDLADENVLSRFPMEFSGGQRQRICLARALILEPRFIVFDEPVSSLDLTMQVEILDLLKRLKRNLSLTYVFITHNLNLLKDISDRILVIQKGRFIH